MDIGNGGVTHNTSRCTILKNKEAYRKPITSWGNPSLAILDFVLTKSK
ncbi:hypothetical protein CpecA_0218 [Chlamydia pecorum IPTaLE]|nr:hypothetical protein CpecS_0220 [Chlamydia pecorum VR629]ETF39117.1 hypothetical protein CpecF_0217 [Chlamydia pecorum DBDeUG]ETF40843.1 hypothetical protein CpecA_0218 [Chlamydia pecorum IPTaLE]